MLVQPGAQIGRYEVKRTLGRGGMGTVYVAHDPVLGRMVAIKLFSADVDLPDAGQRFAREARSAAALNHPNIVTIFDFGENDTQPFIVMEYVQGDSLAEIIRTRAEVPVADKLRWIEGLCAGLAYAHRMSVVHRDIKPANLMIDRSGRLRILDFGIARMIGTASNTAMLLGTPGYTAPEQIRGEPVDHRADIFAAGVVLYELVALREAFPGEAAVTIMHRVLNEEPAPLSEVIPEVRPEIVAICARALNKQPGERFESAEQMREAVSRVRVELDMEAGLTIIPGAVQRDVPPAPDIERPPVEARPATGSTPARRPTGPRRTDRESLARRRADLLATEVQIGRERLQRGDIEGARESCLRALTVDEGHAEVLALERDVEIAAAAAETTAATG
ncbi:MAG TPA: protein kinase, partial [Phenylobacterium sp.]|nr:protein kinase [Phenylobacterium sp.]